jgi:hypothetical protein
MPEIASIETVFELLRKTGDHLRRHLWHPEDLETLGLIAGDLVGLDKKMRHARTLEARKRYAEASSRLLDHAALLALSRLNVAHQDVLRALRDFFFRLIEEWLPGVLSGIARALGLVSSYPVVELETAASS